MEALKLYNQKIIELNLQDRYVLNDLEKLE